MTNADFSLSKQLTDVIELTDYRSQSNNEIISGMAKAISKISEDETIKILAKHINNLAEDTMNEVNAMAERLGANYKESIK